MATKHKNIENIIILMKQLTSRWMQSLCLFVRTVHPFLKGKPLLSVPGHNMGFIRAVSRSPLVRGRSSPSRWRWRTRPSPATLRECSQTTPARPPLHITNTSGFSHYAVLPDGKVQSSPPRVARGAGRAVPADGGPFPRICCCPPPSPPRKAKK